MESHYFIAKVYGTTITYEDILSLKINNYLTDKIMDAYLEYVAQREMDRGIKKVKHMLVTTTTNILNGNYVIGRHEKNQLKPFDYVIGDYHQRGRTEKGGHWNLLIVEPSNKKIVFLNPMGETAMQSRTVPLKWKKYIGQLLLKYPEDILFLNKDWKFDIPQHSNQQDGSNCGIYCLMFAEKYLDGVTLHVTSAEATQKRKNVARTMMMFEGPV